MSERAVYIVAVRNGFIVRLWDRDVQEHGRMPAAVTEIAATRDDLHAAIDRLLADKMTGEVVSLRTG